MQAGKNPKDRMQASYIKSLALFLFIYLFEDSQDCKCCYSQYKECPCSNRKIKLFISTRNLASIKKE